MILIVAVHLKHSQVFIISLQDSLIPTMPQDDLADIRQTLLSAVKESDNPTMYRKLHF